MATLPVIIITKTRAMLGRYHTERKMFFVFLYKKFVDIIAPLYEQFHTISVQEY